MPHRATTASQVRDTSLWSAISNLERGFERTATLLDTVSQRMSGLETKITEGARTPWAAIGIVIAIMTFVLGGFGAVVSYAFLSNLSNISNRIDVVAGTVAEHTGNGHPTAVIAKIESNTQAIKDQREILDKFYASRFQDQQRQLDRFYDRMNRLEGSLETGLYAKRSEGGGF